MKGIVLKETLSSLLNFEFVYDCLENPRLIKKIGKL